MQSYLDLSTEEIARKYDLLHSQWEALGLTSIIETEKVLNTLQDRSVGNDEASIINNLEQLFAYKEGDSKNKFRDETCTYCNMKGHKENVCFTKCDDTKSSKLAEKCTSAMTDHLSTYNKESMEAIMSKLKSLFLNAKG